MGERPIYALIVHQLSIISNINIGVLNTSAHTTLPDGSARRTSLAPLLRRRQHSVM